MKTQLFTLAALGFCAPLGGIHAQTVPLLPVPAPTDAIRPAQTDWSRFESVFTALSEKYQTAFVCESAPLHPALSPEAAGALQKAVFASDSKKEAITAAALAFDYEPVIVEDKTVLLTKRYSQAGDAPEVTLEEATRFLNTLREETNSFRSGSDESPDDVIIALLQSATAEQEAAYAAGLRWDQMPRDFQKRYAFASGWSWLRDPLDRLDQLTNRLNGVSKPNATVFKMASFYGIALPAYAGPFRTPKEAGEFLVPLSASVRTEPGGETRYSTADRHPVINGVPIQDIPDSSAPGKIEAGADAPAALLPCQKTLKQWASEINARAAQARAAKTDPFTRVVIPDGIEDKTICLFGAERFLAPLQTVKEVAQVYDLRAGLGQDGVARFILPAARAISGPQEIASETLRLMPAPLRRALQNRADDVAKIHYDGPVFSLDGEKILNAAKADSLYLAAVKRLRVMVEPQLKSAKGGSIPLSAFPAEAKNRIALSALADNALLFEQLTTKRRSLWIGEIPSATFVKIQRLPDKTAYEFSTPKIPGRSSSSLTGSFGPLPR